MVVAEGRWNLTIYERTRPSKISTELLEAFFDNDEDTAIVYGKDIDFLKRNKAELK